MRAVDKINFKNRTAIAYFLYALNNAQILTQKEMWELREEVESKWPRMYGKTDLSK